MDAAIAERPDDRRGRFVLALARMSYPRAAEFLEAGDEWPHDCILDFEARDLNTALKARGLELVQEEHAWAVREKGLVLAW